MSITVTRSDDLPSCHAIRAAVFVEEQGIPRHEDVDGLDGTSFHVLLTDGGRAVGTARILPDGDIAKIGRVAVLREYRGRGHGRRLMQAAMEVARAEGFRVAKLGARVDAVDFYLDLGFEPVGDEFLDVGIPHQMMSRPL